MLYNEYLIRFTFKGRLRYSRKLAPKSLLYDQILRALFWDRSLSQVTGVIVDSVFETKAQNERSHDQENAEKDKLEFERLFDTIDRDDSGELKRSESRRAAGYGRAELLANPAIRARIFAGSIQTQAGLIYFE